uniref:Endonuclease/exonuclease/phosphatase domain-containing protein n=1 Tax=Kalmanozyma brasiliensis (strain GHG001) TaxID=1365824 RepID=V5GGM6_KALBG
MPRLPSSQAGSSVGHAAPAFPPVTDASEPDQPTDDSQLSVLTLNVWGLNYISKLRVPRIKAIATHLASRSTPNYDFVCLQEIWYESKDWRFLKHALAARYPHSKFFYSGAFGSGLAILSRWPILESDTQPYSLNGQPINVGQGDWFVGKACGCVTVDHPRLGLVDVWNTHFVAAGGEDGPEYKRSHRITQAAIQELGVTCDSPLNTWTAGKPLDERATRGAGKRLDYVFFRGPVDADSTTGPALSYAASASSRGKLACKSSSVVVTDIVPDLNCSYSDHFGVESIFDIISDPPPSTSDAARKVGQHRVLTASLHALSGGFAASRSTQMSHFYVFGAALLLAISLIVASIFQPLGGVNPVFVLLAVVAGWAGTTMLYSALVWGEWEKRTLRTVMELIELELEHLRPSQNGAASRTSADQAATGTLF